MCVYNRSLILWNIDWLMDGWMDWLHSVLLCIGNILAIKPNVKRYSAYSWTTCFGVFLIKGHTTITIKKHICTCKWTLRFEQLNVFRYKCWNKVNGINMLTIQRKSSLFFTSIIFSCYSSKKCKSGCKVHWVY